MCGKELNGLFLDLIEPKAGPLQIKTCSTWLFKEGEVTGTSVALG